ncbi:MAG: hypothetical protein ACRDZ3_18235 [Acidimicrobiia bacterium]
MARVSVRPDVLEVVDFDRGRVAELVVDVADGVGLPTDLELVVEIDEASPFGATWTVIDGATVTLSVESGAFEDPKAIRQLSEAGTRLVLGRLLFRLRDRLDPAFGDPPPDPELNFAQHAAWDAYAVGRYARLVGVEGGADRRRYAFRLRHGFTDAADRDFDLLWGGDGLTWADLDLEKIVSAHGDEQPEVGRIAEQA